MANKHTKEKRIQAQEEEINYLKSKLYELAKTNKKLEKELERANHEIQSLKHKKKHFENNDKKHETTTYEKWHRVENKRRRKNRVNDPRQLVSKPRGQTFKPANTPTRKTRPIYTQRNPNTESRRDEQLRSNDH